MERQDIDDELARTGAQELLTSTSMAHLAYIGKGGTPRVIPIGFFWTGDQVVISLPRSRRRSRRCRLARMLHYTSACGAAAVIGRDQSGRRRRNQCQSSNTFQQIRLQLRWSSRTSSRTSAGVFLAATLVPGCGPPRSPRRTQRRRRPSRTPQHPVRGLPRAPRPPWIDIRLGPMPRACLTRQSR